MINPDFVKIAEAYKIPGARIIERKDLKEALTKMLNIKGPYLLEIEIEKEANVLPMVAPGASVSEIRLV